MNTDKSSLAKHFQIQSEVDLDFVIGQSTGLPVGMTRESSPEFRRRIFAAAISYRLQLKSIDHVLKRYVEPDLYEEVDVALGDEVSDYLRSCTSLLTEVLRELHTPDPAFGVFGAEFSLFRIPHAIDVARMLSNRGLLLEVLPVLRLCLEMMCWARVAFGMNDDEEKIIALKAQHCISSMKEDYPSVGRLYGYLSQFTHWGHVIHGQFITFEGDKVGTLYASVRYRAMALALCLVVLDVFVEVIRKIHGEKSHQLISRIQGGLDRSAARRVNELLSKIVDLSGLDDVREIQAFAN